MRRVAREPSNEELIQKLFQEGDRLRRSTVDEILRRGTELIPELGTMCMDRLLWTEDLPGWWAPVHATYLLGAMSSEEVILPLLSALRWSDAYDNEWVTEDLPAMFGKIGGVAIEPLLAVASDQSAGWSARSIALDSLTAIAVVSPQHEERLLRFVDGHLKNKNEHPGVRRAAAIILLDLRVTRMHDALIAFAKEEEQRANEFEDYRPVFVSTDVDRELAIPVRSEEYYRRDWLTFYHDEEIHRRQLAWQQEDQAEAKSRFGPGVGEREAVAEGLRLCPCGSGRMYRHCCWGKLH
ncbi:MAG: SEC-C domain-containing protein [Deltaproteobacteria bacterium]|nr:SEC-C domain-containing protein [Deltaproteobacteria bacterium]